MSPIQLINYLTEHKVLLAAKSGQLSISYADDNAAKVLTPQLVEQLKAHKSQILDLLEAQNSTDANSLAHEQLDIKRVSRDAKSYPLSFAQARLWFIHQLERPLPGEKPPVSAYNMPFCYQVEGLFDVQLAKLALWQVISSNEILRTVYTQDDNKQPIAVILPQSQAKLRYNFEHIDLSAQAFNQGLIDKVTGLVQQHAQQWFDLACDLPICASFIQLPQLKLNAEQNESSNSRGLLLINMHHIACDGWSLAIVTEQFATCYQALVRGNSDFSLSASSHAKQPLQYVDFAAWQQHLGQSQIEKELKFWRHQLAQLPMLHGMPLDKPRPSSQSFKGQRVDSFIAGDVLAGLERLARKHNITMFMLLHGAVALLISRYSGSQDIVIGTVVANRTHSALEQMVGCFINNLVLRAQTDISDIDDYFAHIRQVNLDAQANQNVPFEQLVEQFKLQRTTAYSPLFQIMLAMNNMASNLDMGNQSLDSSVSDDIPLISPLASDSDFAKHNKTLAAKYDLEITAEQRGDGMALVWLFDTALFDLASIQTYSEQLLKLLQAMAFDDSAKTVQAWPLLSDKTTEQLIRAGGDEAACQLDKPTIPEQIEFIAQKYPDTIALEQACIAGDSTQRLSYAQLNHKAQRLAQIILKRLSSRCQSDSTAMVGVCLQRSVDLVVTLLAVLKAGAAYVPLDPDYPSSRLVMVVEDAKLDLVLSQSDLIAEHEVFTSAIEAVAIDKLGLDGNESSPCSSGPLDLANIAIKSEHPAYVIFTSGSTGRPKGVEISHQALATFIPAMVSRINQSGEVLRRNCRFLAITTIAFDIAGLEIFAPLCVGGTVVVAADDDKLNPKRIAGLIDNDIDLLQGTPSFWQMMLSSDWQGADITALCGGEALSADLGLQLKSKVSRLFNCYGPTEATIWSIVDELSKRDCQTQVLLTNPLAGYRHVVLDAMHNLVPVGAIGELYIGGEALATGYYGNSEQTQANFIATPEHLNTAHLGPVLYKTADLVRLVNKSADKLQWQYIGRSDSQIKLNGFRIELNDIKSQLLAFSNGELTVKQAVVVLADKRLLAFIEMNNHQDDSAYQQAVIDKLNGHLLDTLPRYMLPSSYHLLDVWPMTDNGKIDVKALRVMGLETQAASAADDFKPPIGEIEIQLASFWGELLPANGRFSREDDFFYRGGHSLLAVRLVDFIEQHWSIAMSVRSVFEAPKLWQLADEIAARISVATDSDLTAKVPRLKAAQHLPLDNGQGYKQLTSFAQQRMWFINQLDPNSTEYNMAYALNVKGQLDLQRTEQALTQIIARHHVLSTVYQQQDNQVYQYYRDDSPLQKAEKTQPSFSLAVADLSELSEQEQQTKLVALIGKDRQSSFDLANDLMLRASYIKLAAKRGVLLFNMHHIATDGWSMGILVDEFVRLYQDQQLERLSLQYADYALWQRHWLASGQLEKQLAYWQLQLADAPSLHGLPLQAPRAEIKQHNGAIIDQQLSSVEFQQMSKLAKDNGMTVFMLLHSLLNLVLCRHSGDSQMLIGTPMANRDHSDLNGMIGCFINTLVLKGNCQHRNFGEYFADIRNTHIDAQSNSQLPFEYLVEQLPLSRSTAYTPLFQVFMSMNTFESGQLSIEGVDFWPVESNAIEARFDLELIAQVTEQTDEQGKQADSLSWSWVYDTALFSQAKVAEFNQHLVNLIEALCAKHMQGVDFNSLALSSVGMLNQSEQQSIINQAKSNLLIDNTKADLTIDVIDLFNQQVACHGDAVALFSADVETQSLTYKQLNQGANHVAHYLRALLKDSLGESEQVDGNIHIGVCVERDIFLPVMLLGILKAGYCYVPLDRESPVSRLEYMIADSQLRYVLADISASEFDFSNQSFSQLWLDISTQFADFTNEADKLSPELTVNTDPNCLAYVMYTSGSTGLPKGVGVSRGAIGQRFASFQTWLPFTQGDIIAAIAAPTFDISLLELFYPLCCGASVMMVSKEQTLDSKGLVAQLKPCSFIHMVPSLANLWLEQLTAQDMADYQQRLAYFATGGDKVPESLLSQLHQQLNHTQLMQFYGPTEAVLFSVCNRYSYGAERSFTDKQQYRVLGSAIAGVSLYLLDQHQNLAAKGALGEIALGGPLASGYLNLNEQTEQSFVEYDWCGERLYRTGDLARYDSLDRLHFVGRNDGQVKIRGMRVELGEIEQKLTGLKVLQSRENTSRENTSEYLIKQAVVLVDKNAPSNPLVAFVLLDGALDGQQMVQQPQNTAITGALVAKSVARDLAQLLPTHMLVQRFVVVDKWPLTANAKVDRKALATRINDAQQRGELLGFDVHQHSDNFIAPSSQIAITLAQIWAEVLGISQSHISADANFFDIGGHSLLVGGLIERIKQHFEVDFSVRQAFVHQQLDDCAEQISLLVEQQASQGQAQLAQLEQQFTEQVENMSDEQVEAMLALMEQQP